MCKKVLIIQRRLTKYRVPLFEEMRSRLLQQDIEISVAYSKPTASEVLRNDEGELTWGMLLQGSYLRIRNTALLWQSLPRSVASKQDLIVLSHENSLLINYLLLIRRLWGGPRLAFWGQGANFQHQEKKGIAELFRTKIGKAVDWWFAYTAKSVQKVAESGFPIEHITCLNNAIDTRSLRQWSEGITAIELKELKLSIGIQSENVGIFLGSLHEGKRINFLLAILDQVRARLSDFECIIVGDGPMRDAVRVFAKARPWVHWVGARNGREKVLYLRLGQIMLNPGLVGLSILDSFALELPLVTTSFESQSSEIAYLDSGRNGVMTDNNEGAFVQGVVDLLKNRSLIRRLAAACKKDSSKYSLENMVANYCNGIKDALRVSR